ncbi:MAG TPA: efflux RND transporter periplasmic adaptor subunit [Anaerolineales bacterium]|nr:efflux RND transporter periplasmic adaptor subunit [Anaerolineales bacterium]
MKKLGNWFKNIKKRTWIILAVVVVLALLIGIPILRKRSNTAATTTYQTAKVEKGTLTATIGATGTVRSNQTAILTWQTSGTIGEIKVQPGDQVKAGDILASLSQTSLPQSIILAQSDLVTAQRNLDSVKQSATQQAQAELNLVTAEKNYDSAKGTLDNYLASNHGGTTEDVLNAQAKLVVAQNNLKAAQTYYDYAKHLSETDSVRAQAYTNLYNAQQALKNAQDNLNYFILKPGGRDVEEAQAKLDLAKAQLDDAQREWDRLKGGPDPSDILAAQAKVDAAQAAINMANIISPFGGTVTEVSGMVGDQVAPGTSAFRVDDLSHMQVDVQVSEVDINSVQVGQPVVLTFDAISGQPYSGKVVEVAKAGDTIQGAVDFTVTVELTNADASVKPGMTAAVTITVEQLNNVLLVPNRAVRLVDSQRVVYILRNGQAQMVNVTLGASSDTMSEVVSSDLKVGDLVILNPPSTLFNQRPGGGGGGAFGGGL